MKDTLIEMNNLQGNKSRVDEAKNQINDLEHKEEKTSNQYRKKKKRIQNNEDSTNSLWDNFKRSSIRLIGVPEGEEKEQEIGNLFEKIMKGYFPNLVKELNIKSRKYKES